MTAKEILQKKGVYKAEMDRIMSVEQRDALWQKATEKLDTILNRYRSLPSKGVRKLRRSFRK